MHSNKWYKTKIIGRMKTIQFQHSSCKPQCFPLKRLEHFIRKVGNILIRKLKRVETILQNEGGYQDLHAKLNQIKIYLQEKKQGFYHHFGHLKFYFEKYFQTEGKRALKVDKNYILKRLGRGKLDSDTKISDPMPIKF